MLSAYNCVSIIDHDNTQQLIVMKNGAVEAVGSYKDIESKHPYIVNTWNDLIVKANEREQRK